MGVVVWLGKTEKRKSWCNEPRRLLQDCVLKGEENGTTLRETSGIRGRFSKYSKKLHLHASWNDPEEIEGDDNVGERSIINHQSQVLVCESEKGKSGCMTSELRASGRGLWSRVGTAHHCAEWMNVPRLQVQRSVDLVMGMQQRALLMVSIFSVSKIKANASTQCQTMRMNWVLEQRGKKGTK